MLTKIVFLVWSASSHPAWILLGLMIDFLLGDPIGRYHPVRLIGTSIAFGEKGLRRLFHSPTGLRWAGAILTIAVTSMALILVTTLLLWTYDLSSWAFEGFVVVLTALGLAARGLGDAALSVYRPLQRSDWAQARVQLSQLVGRDTTRLPLSEMVRAVVESLAENTCDAVVAPLFFALLGGPAWLWAYKTINTLDSMVGYRNRRYEHFGWFAARLDDWANWIPARISGLAIAVAASLEGRFHESYGIMRQFGHQHPSPNSGVSEAAMAGALGVSLGGPNSYGGVVALRPKIGFTEQPLNPSTILQAVYLTQRATIITASVLSVASLIVTGRWF